MGNITTHPNVISHSDVIELYKKFKKSDADKIYVGMDKTDYRKKYTDHVRYIDLEKLQNAVVRHKREHNTDELLSVKLTYSNKKLDVNLPINYYTLRWRKLDKTICEKQI